MYSVYNKSGLKDHMMTRKGVLSINIIVFKIKTIFLRLDLVGFMFLK